MRVIISGSIGYLMFRNQIKQIVLSSFENSDILIQVVRITLFIAVTVSYPAISLSVTTDLNLIILKQPDSSVLSKKQSSPFLLLSNFRPALIVMFVPNIAPALSIGGSLVSCFTSFFFFRSSLSANSSHR
jgi:hypothetical protein